MHFIFIDFTGEKSVLGFGSARKVFFTFGSGRNGISLLGKLFKKIKIKPNGIIAVIGPGRFSAVRSGILSANMLAELLRVKIVGLLKRDGENPNDIFRRGVFMFKKRKTKKEISPFYGAEPNITLPSNDKT